MRLRATTGTVRAGASVHTMRARTNCSVRKEPPSGSTALTRTDWVAVSTEVDTNDTWVVSRGWPRSSTSWTGRPTLRFCASCTGTLTYTSRPAFWSTVVSTVDRVTLSPTRTGMSPTTPATGAVTRW